MKKKNECLSAEAPGLRFAFLFAGCVIVLCIVFLSRRAYPQRPVPQGSTAAASANQFLYVTNNAGDSVSAFSVGAFGRLQPVSGSPFAAGSGPTAVAVDPHGNFVYVANFDGNNVSGFAIDASTGALTPVPGSPTATGNGPYGVAVSPSGRFLYVANQEIDNFPAGDVSAFSIDPGTGALTPVSGSPFPTGGVQPVAAAARAGFLYVADIYSSDVAVFRINSTTGALSPIPGSPFSTGTIHYSDPSSVVVTAADAFVYTGDFDFFGITGEVTGFAVTAGTGALTMLPGSPFPTGGEQCDGAALDQSGKFLYVVNQTSNSVSGFTVNADGSLTLVPGSPIATGGTEAVDVAVARNARGEFVYVTNLGGGISGFRVSPSTGGLTPLRGSPFPDSLNPWGVAFANVRQ